jgi:hypothetical protein
MKHLTSTLLGKVTTSSAIAIASSKSLVSRRFSVRAEAGYIDQWFESIKKKQDFYDLMADGGKTRRYFYNIDLQGRLFLEETSPKNIATSIKDERFLNFFFSRIQEAKPSDLDFLVEFGYHNDYPFVSKCGKEINYIRPAGTPIVFHTLNHDGYLKWGGNLQMKFDEQRLAISSRNGRLYHPLVSEGMKISYGLIKSSVAVGLADKISEGDEGVFLYDRESVIDWLPIENEPGRWAMPDEV